MSAVCRVCLAAGNTTLHALLNNLLIGVYEILSKTKFNCGDARPRVICQSCYRKLLRGHAFSQMAHRSEKIFDQIYDTGLEATYECLSETNLGMNQKLSVPQQFDTIDGNATATGSRVTIKDKPIPSIDIKEEVTTEQAKVSEDRRMSAVCRVCLAASNTTLHSLIDNLLIHAYEILSNTKFNREDARPRVICQSCHRKLLRCHAFSQMAHRSEKIFDRIYDKGLEATHECITEINLEMNQQLSVTTQQFDTIDGNATDADSQITIKDEPIPSFDIKEEVTTDQDSVVEVGSVAEDSTEIQLTLEEDNSHRENGDGEFPSYNNVEQTKQDYSKMTLFCNNCNKIFFNKYKLISHIRNSHSQCKGNQIEHFVELMRTHKGEKPFACNVCNKRFKHNDYLVSHLRTHTEKEPFAFGVCDEQFKRNIHLLNHARTHTGEKSFTCHVCGKQFKKSSNLYAHMRTHTREKPFACCVCDKRFIQKACLNRHVRIHTGEKPFTCHVCAKQFKQNSHLVNHIRSHTGEKSFACNVCDKRFRNSSNLASHSRAHTRDKPYACSVCDKRFSRKAYLIPHVRIHTGEKPFTCHVCAMQFKQNSHLVNHMRSHTGEKSFACNVCDKQFRNNNNLAYHSKTHIREQPYACSVCDKRFKRKEYLVAHVRTHTGEKPFACHVCDKQFKQNGHLISHARLHTGEKPFTCNECDKQFNNKSNLQRHVIIHK